MGLVNYNRTGSSCCTANVFSGSSEWISYSSAYEVKIYLEDISKICYVIASTYFHMINQYKNYVITSKITPWRQGLR